MTVFLTSAAFSCYACFARRLVVDVDVLAIQLFFVVARRRRRRRSSLLPTVRATRTNVRKTSETPGSPHTHCLSGTETHTDTGFMRASLLSRRCSCYEAQTACTMKKRKSSRCSTPSFGPSGSDVLVPLVRIHILVQINGR